ncbi:MAG: 2-oxoglutarate oxidoreductase subunit KorB [Legionellaceae bacterium]
MMNTVKNLTRADFVSNQEVRWCPGCGDYSILASVQKVMPELGIPKENIVFISGIGCSGRFPYYMNTYGFHTIHGRAPAITTGLKITRPDLSIWMITGDGDALSIGGNHLIHILRRNLDVNILLLNNRIYGLTKGQYSPTSESGKITGTSPQGSIDQPLDPISIALAAGATFVGRALDIDAKGLQTLLKAAAEHKGTAFIEIYQNCNIYNDGAFEHLSGKEFREDRILWLEQGKPLIFGKNKDKAIKLKGLQPQVVTLEGNENDSDLLIHDASQMNSAYAHLLTQMGFPEFPVPMGIIRQIEKPVYENILQQQVDLAIYQRGNGNINELFHSGEVWTVDE